MNPLSMPIELRSLLQAVLRHAGVLYQPLVIDAVPFPRELGEQVRAVAESQDCRFFAALEDVRALPLGAKSVLFLSLADVQSDAERALLAAPPGCQVVIWSAAPVSVEDAERRGWLAGGFVVRYPRPTSGPLSIRHNAVAQNVAHALVRPGRSYNPLIVITNPADIERAAADLALRFQACPLFPLEILDPPFSASRWGAKRSPLVGSGLVVRLRSSIVLAEDEAARVLDALEQAHAVPVQIALVMDPEMEDRLESEAGWRTFLAHGVTVRISDVLAAAGEPAVDALAPLRSVLAARPIQVGRGESVFAGWLSRVPLVDALQFSANSFGNGRLVVFGQDRVAFIDFRRGRIVHVGPQECWPRLLDIAGRREIDLSSAGPLETLAREVMTERILEIATWTGAGFTFVSREVESPIEETVSLDPQAVLMSLVRSADDWPQMERKIGPTSARWEAKGEAAPASSAEATLLWRALDPTRPVATIARELGIGRFEMAALLEDMRASGAAACVSTESTAGERFMDFDAVLRTLWAEGLTSDAYELATTVGEGVADPSAVAYYRAWLLVERGEWEAAAEQFEIAAASQEPWQRDAARMNHVLLSVRYLGRQPVAALERLRQTGLIRADGTCAGALAAGAAEVALRAGDVHLAESLVRMATNVEARASIEERLQGR